MKRVSPAARDRRPPFAGKLFPSVAADIFASGARVKQARCTRAPAAESAPRLIICTAYAIIADGRCCDVVCTTGLYDSFRQRSIIIKITATERIHSGPLNINTRAHVHMRIAIGTVERAVCRLVAHYLNLILIIPSSSSVVWHTYTQTRLRVKHVNVCPVRRQTRYFAAVSPSLPIRLYGNICAGYSCILHSYMYNIYSI